MGQNRTVLTSQCHITETFLILNLFPVEMVVQELEDPRVVKCSANPGVKVGLLRESWKSLDQMGVERNRIFKMF